MSKDRRNISLDPEVNESIDANVVFSDLVNEWTRQYFIEGNTYNVEKAMLETMLEQVEDSREAMHEQVDEMHDELAAKFQAEIEHLDSVGYDEKKQVGSEAQWVEALDVLKNAARDTTNPAIKNWAGKLNVSPEELVERLIEEHGSGGSTRSQLNSLS